MYLVRQNDIGIGGSWNLWSVKMKGNHFNNQKTEILIYPPLFHVKHIVFCFTSYQFDSNLILKLRMKSINLIANLTEILLKMAYFYFDTFSICVIIDTFTVCVNININPYTVNNNLLSILPIFYFDTFTKSVYFDTFSICVKKKLNLEH